MKNLHRINQLNLTDIQKLAIIEWFYAKRTSEPRVLINNEGLHYWIMRWRPFTNMLGWAEQAKMYNKTVDQFRKDMVIIGDENAEI